MCSGSGFQSDWLHILFFLRRFSYRATVGREGECLIHSLLSSECEKWLLQAKPQRGLTPTTHCWHSWLRSNKNKMRSESPSNQLPEHIHSTHSAFYHARHLERNAELGISLHVLQ